MPGRGRRNWKRVLLEKLPRPVRLKLIRRLIQAPSATPPELVVRLAQSQEELAQAYRILHDAYVEAGFMTAHPSLMRITKYFMLPSTNTFIAIWNGQIVGTMSVIRDSFFGLPADQIFEMKSLRHPNRSLAEVSSLAIAAPFRHQRGQIFLPLIKFLYHYARHSLRIDDLVVAVNPAWEDFYCSLFAFERLKSPRVSSYSFVNGAPAVGLNLDLVTVETHLRKLYSGIKSPSVSAYVFDTPEPERICLPERRFIKVEDTFMTAPEFKHFFIEQSETLKQLSMDELRSLHMLIRDPNIKALLPIPIDGVITRKAPRIPSELIATSSLCSSPIRVRNVSREGLAIMGWTSTSDHIDLSLRVSDSETAQIRGKIVWRDSDKLSAGVRITNEDAVWTNFLAWLEEDSAQHQLQAKSNPRRQAG